MNTREEIIWKYTIMSLLLHSKQGTCMVTLKRHICLSCCLHLSTILVGMQPTVKLRVLIEEDIKKLVLKNGIPLTLEELV